jgi:uncharacterized protein
LGYVKRHELEEVLKSLSNFKVVAIIGPRQVGKSTLASTVLRKGDLWLDLERPSDLRKVEDPETFLSLHSDKLICIDEVQFLPDVFSVLWAQCDAHKHKGQFLILGSASPDLLKQSSDSLAGRIKYIELSPFSITDIKSNSLYKLWLKGGFPDSYLSEEKQSFDWREAYIKMFLERDLSVLGLRRSPAQMRRFWTMLAHLQGQTLNQSKLAGNLDATSPTIKSFIDMMVDTFMIRVLPPLHKNIKKRLVKSPKVYIRDSGVLHALLDIETFDQLQGNPVYGASFEGFAIEQVLTNLSSKWKYSYYRSAKGEEIDLILQLREKTIAVEIKCSKAPMLTKQNKMAIETVAPDHTYLLSLVNKPYQLDRSTTVTNILGLISDLKKAD